MKIKNVSIEEFEKYTEDKTFREVDLPQAPLVTRVITKTTKKGEDDLIESVTDTYNFNDSQYKRSLGEYLTKPQSEKLFSVNDIIIRCPDLGKK